MVHGSQARQGASPSSSPPPDPRLTLTLNPNPDPNPYPHPNPNPNPNLNRNPIQGKYLSSSTGSRFTGEWKSGQLVASTVHSSDGSKFFSGFEGGVPSGAGAFALSNGSLVRGVHNLPPKEEGEEEEEGAPPKQSTWAGGATVTADHMSAAQLAVQFEAGKPSQRKALVIGISYGEGGAFPEPYVEPLEVEAPPAAEEPAAEAAEGGEEAAAEPAEGEEPPAEGEGGEPAAEVPPPPPPPTFFSAAAEALKGVLTGPLKMAAADVTVLAPKDAEDASLHTKEKVSEAIALTLTLTPTLAQP